MTQYIRAMIEAMDLRDGTFTTQSYGNRIVVEKNGCHFSYDVKFKTTFDKLVKVYTAKRQGERQCLSTKN